MDDDRKYGNTSRVRITIPGFHRIFNDVGKGYTVYKVIIAKPGGQKEIEKRYNEFYILNKTLKENHKLPQGQVINFPPKKLNTSVATKEERRRKLEGYLQVLCVQDPIAPEVLSFLDISQPQPMEADSYTSSCEDLLALSTNSTHQPIMGFPSDPFAVGQQGQPCTIPSDELLEGILDGLYGNLTSCYVNGVANSN